MKNPLCLFILLLLAASACRVHEARPYDFPKPVDTTTKAITEQKKKTYALSNQDIYADNQFDGARLNHFQWVKDQVFRATIEPENIPINHSPYYAFRLWSEQPRSIQLELHYTEARHRYWPKLSSDGRHWQALDSSRFELSTDSVNAFLKLDIGPDTLWIAGQEIQNSTHVQNWCENISKHADVRLSSIGKSKLGRDLWFLNIGRGEVRKKEVIVVLSRQHPPEVTGYFAMQAFIDEILADNPLSNDFRQKYQILVFPLMNPDGVDLGHWRHNAGGIDLNRDWAYYHQPENRQVANFIVQFIHQHKSKLILGLDFHSTWKDIYYTNRKSPGNLPYFKDYWLWGIHQSLGEKTNERPSNIGGPVSKNWFLTQFDAEGITYEIGDDTPRDFIQKKGKVSATEMMELLILK